MAVDTLHSSDPARPRGAKQTRHALIETGIDLFGSRGFEAASIRDIARQAGTNLAAIGYHFGGKDGLRLACAQFAAEFLTSMARSGFAARMASDSEADSHAQARKRIEKFVVTVVRGILTEPRAERIVRFLLREISTPGEPFDILYRDVFAPTHKRICHLWAAVTGEDPQSESVRLGVFAILGQAIYFRIGAVIVTRRMEWAGYGRAEADRIAREIVENLLSALDRHALGARSASGEEGGSK